MTSLLSSGEKERERKRKRTHFAFSPLLNWEKINVLIHTWWFSFRIRLRDVTGNPSLFMPWSSGNLCYMIENKVILVFGEVETERDVQSRPKVETSHLPGRDLSSRLKADIFGDA